MVDASLSGETCHITSETSQMQIFDVIIEGILHNIDVTPPTKSFFG
jgi:hypothetical protein